MSNDFDNIVKSLASAQQGKVSGEKIEKFSKIFATPQGKAVIEAITKDGGKSLQSAIENIQKGNSDAAKNIVASLMNTKEGAEIIKQIVKTAEQEG